MMTVYSFPAQNTTLTHLDYLRGRMVKDIRAIAHAPSPIAARVRDFLVVRSLFVWDAFAWRTKADEEVKQRDEQDAALEIHFLRRMLQEMQREFGLPLEDSAETARMLLLATNALPCQEGAPAVRGREDLRKLSVTLAETLVQGLVPTRRVTWQESPRIDSTAL